MSTELEIKNEMIAAIKAKIGQKKVDAHFWTRIETEINDLIAKEDTWGKPVIQKIYSQWQSGKRGHKNPFNSLLAYSLGITSAAPKGEYSLPKRRAFARPSPPDIDSDFDHEKRHMIIDYLVWKYGRGNVGNIGTYGALKMRSALTRIIKALDIADAFRLDKDGKPITDRYTSENVKKVNEILGTLPKQYGAVLTVKDRNGEEVTLKSTKDVVETDSAACNDFRFYMKKHPEIYRHALNIEGLLSVFSCVAADTPILTQNGWVRIDQLDSTCKISYLNAAGEMRFSDKYKAWYTGKKKCYRLKLADGNSVDLTDDHLVLTDHGYVELREIRKNTKTYKVFSLPNSREHNEVKRI